jgi:transposase
VSVAPIPSAPADLELIAQLKMRLQFAELKIRVLEERLRLMRIEKYGAGGERLSHAQMELFDSELAGSGVIVQPEGEQVPARRSTKTSCRHPGRQEFPPNLPRVERILPCSPGISACAGAAAKIP